MREASERRSGALAIDEDGQEDHRSATMLSSISGLTNTIIGSGMLALPHAFASMGWLLGSALVLFCAAVTNFGLYLVRLCQLRMAKQPQSFYDMTSQVIPSAVWYFDAIIFVKCFGVGVSYLMITGHLMPQVVLNFAQALGFAATGVPAFLQSQSLWTIASLVAVGTFFTYAGPACFYRKLNELRIVGYLNMAAVLYLLAILLYYFFSKSDRAALPSRGDVSAILFSIDVLRTFPILVFAYTCAQNILPVYCELKDATVKRTQMVTSISIGTSALVYIAVATLGYAMFGSNVGDNIIAMYPAWSLFVSFGKLSVIALTLTSYPMQLYPCRASLINMLEIKVNMLVENDSEHAVLVPGSSEADPVTHHEVDNQRWWVITLALMGVGLLVSMTVDDLSIILGIVGALGSTTISFILPAILYLRLYHDERNTLTSKAAYVLGVWGTIVLVLALTVNLSRFFRGV